MNNISNQMVSAIIVITLLAMLIITVTEPLPDTHYDLPDSNGKNIRGLNYETGEWELYEDTYNNAGINQQSEGLTDSLGLTREEIIEIIRERERQRQPNTVQDYWGDQDDVHYKPENIGN